MRVKQLSQNDLAAMKDTNEHEITHEQLQNEFDYYKVEKLLEVLLENNLISKAEFVKTNELNRQKYNPLLAPLMSDNT